MKFSSNRSCIFRSSRPEVFLGKAVSACFQETKTHFQINLFSFVFKMALSKVDLIKQIVVLQNVWISACNIFNSVISFLTGRHKRQTEII